MQCEGNRGQTSLTPIGHAAVGPRSFHQHVTGVIIMKLSLAALIAACAVASSAFAAFDIPPVIPPHFAALDIPPVIPPHFAALDIPPVIPPHFAA
jgi:hypothetical protein